MKTMRLNHVTLTVTDFERSVAFYSALGLVLIVHETQVCTFPLP
jgi:catechol 2,3-dioxygenase-like lactoylglutathione lyase family enzyme